MVYYKLVKVTINILRLSEVIVDVVLRHYGLSDLSIIDWGLFSTQSFNYHYAIF